MTPTYSSLATLLTGEAGKQGLMAGTFWFLSHPTASVNKEGEWRLGRQPAFPATAHILKEAVKKCIY